MGRDPAPSITPGGKKRVSNKKGGLGVLKTSCPVVYLIIEEELNLTEEKAVLRKRKGGAYQIEKIGPSRPVGKNPNRGRSKDSDRQLSVSFGKVKSLLLEECPS